MIYLECAGTDDCLEFRLTGGLVIDYLPSPFGRRAGDEGIEAKYFLDILVFSEDSLR
jgi:hypothetical protein